MRDHLPLTGRMVRRHFSARAALWAPHSKTLEQRCGPRPVGPRCALETLPSWLPPLAAPGPGPQCLHCLHFTRRHSYFVTTVPCVLPRPQERQPWRSFHYHLGPPATVFYYSYSPCEEMEAQRAYVAKLGQSTLSTVPLSPLVITLPLPAGI